MSPLRAALTEYREAVAAFSRPARFFLGSVFLTWLAQGVAQVVFNLYLVEAGFRESFVGTAISVTAIGVAVVAIPAGWLADRWGTGRCLVLGAVLEGLGMIVRSTVIHPAPILTAAFLTGTGQSLLAIAAAPFIAENSTSRERTHLFSTFFAVELLAGVFGSAIGGSLPGVLRTAVPSLDLHTAYRVTLVVGGLASMAGALPVMVLRPGPPAPHPESSTEGTGGHQLIVPIAIFALMIGAGAGLVIPFMNLYFATRFHCSSAQIGLFFSVAQILTATAALIGPLIARSFGNLRTAIGSQLLSLPFLVSLGAERHLSIAVGAFWIRATLMQAAAPLLQSLIMQEVPAHLRARTTSVLNLLWNIGWAVSSTASGRIIQHFGYAVPFYVTAVLYAAASVYFYRAFAPVARAKRVPGFVLTEEAKGARGEGPISE